MFLKITDEHLRTCPECHQLWLKLPYPYDDQYLAEQDEFGVCRHCLGEIVAAAPEEWLREVLKEVSTRNEPATPRPSRQTVGPTGTFERRSAFLRSAVDSKVDRHHIILFADCFQFYLQDERAEGDLLEAWTEKAGHDLLAIAYGTIGVGTIDDGLVWVSLELAHSEPTLDLAEWDHVTECGISVPSGTLLLAGGTDLPKEAHRVRTNPGHYRARIFYGGLYPSETRKSWYPREYYKVVLWPSQLKDVVILKRWLDVDAVEVSLN